MGITPRAGSTEWSLTISIAPSSAWLIPATAPDAPVATA